MAHIVIMGAGLGGIPMAYEMKALLGPEDELTVISNSDIFQFTPSNPWVAVNWRKKDDIVVPMAPIFARQGIDFIPVGAERVLPEENAIRLLDGRTVNYDYLVIATGPELAFDEIPGFGPHGGFTQSVCHVDHATEAAAAWERFTADPGPIVVGAVQGASCFGPAYEFALIMETELRRRKIRDKVPMTFVTAEPYIGHFGLGGVGDTKGMLESEFRQRHITWITNAKVNRIEDGKAVVTECDSEGAEKRTVELPFKYAMMIPAFRGIKAVAGIDGLVNPRGFVLIDKFQRNPKFENVFGIGVCVAIPPVEQTPVPTGVPKTGFMIESMVTATAHNIREMLDGKPPSHEATWNALCLADFGDRGVALLAMPQMPPRNVNWTYSGKLVHVAKIAFEKYFLRKVRSGVSEPFYEKYGLKLLGIDKLKSLMPHQ
jgi:sulfide:quinone oxidoreductase